MASRYRIGDRILADDELPTHADLLRRAALERLRPACLCQPVGREPTMYLSLLQGRHRLKRMPLTGALHAPHCDHYEAPAELSGQGQVSGRAIREDPCTGMTSLHFDFALSAGACRSPAAAAVGDTGGGVSGDGSRLSLRAALHYLWDEAGLTRWVPRMAGRRGWQVVQRELRRAAEHKVARGEALAALLFVPEPFQAEDGTARQARQAAQLSRLDRAPGSRMLCIAEVKALQPARFGHRVLCRHLPDLPLHLDDELHARLTRRYRMQLELWEAFTDSHLLLGALIGRSASGLHEVHSACLMNVNAGWLPFDSAAEHRLLDALAGRRFTKGLRYNLAADRLMASVVLQDTAPPTALYLASPDGAPVEGPLLQEAASRWGLASWWWRPDEEAMPALPPAAALR